MKNYFKGLQVGLGILTILFMGMFIVKSAWSGPNNLTATSGETLTLDKWNLLVSKIESQPIIDFGVIDSPASLTWATVNFSKTFTSPPVVVVSANPGSSSATDVVNISNIQTGLFQYYFTQVDNSEKLYWIAIGN